MVASKIPLAVVCALVSWAVMSVSAVPTAAQDPKPSNTKMTFRLEDHQLVSGQSAGGMVTLKTTRGPGKSPLVGATLTVKLDGAVYSTLVTNSEGKAAVSIVAPADGHHLVKVVYAGPGKQDRATRTQGFVVGAAHTPSPSLSPSPSVSTSPSATP